MQIVFGTGPGIREWLEELQREAIRKVRNAAPERVRFSPEDVAEEVAASVIPDVIQIDWERMSRSNTEETTRQAMQFGEVVNVRGLIMTIYVPYTGNPRLLNLQASTFSFSGHPKIETWDGHIVFQVDVSEGDANLTRQRIDAEKARISKQVEWANNDAVAWVPNLRTAIGQQLHRRKEELDKAAALDAALDLPIKSADSDRQVNVPVARRNVRVTRTSAPTGPKDPRISEQIYEDVVDTIRSVGNAFERLPQTAGRFKEEELRDLLLFVLNSNYEGLARGEVFNGTGKTDILIPYQDHNPFVGECKVWRGPKQFSAAIDQVLGYTVWRDTKAALILLIKSGDASDVITKADQRIREHSSFVSARSPQDAQSRRDYLLHATDDAAKHIQVALLPIVVRKHVVAADPAEL